MSAAAEQPVDDVHALAGALVDVGYPPSLSTLELAADMMDDLSRA